MSVRDIFKRYTNSESATRPRSSFERTTSDSMSSTATRARVESGPPCSRMPACWKRTQRLGRCTCPTLYDTHSTYNVTDVNNASRENYQDDRHNPQIETYLTTHWVLEGHEPAGRTPRSSVQSCGVPRGLWVCQYEDSLRPGPS
jgi:hypothetical protein